MLSSPGNCAPKNQRKEIPLILVPRAILARHSLPAHQLACLFVCSSSACCCKALRDFGYPKYGRERSSTRVVPATTTKKQSVGQANVGSLLTKTTKIPNTNLKVNNLEFAWSPIACFSTRETTDECVSSRFVPRFSALVSDRFTGTIGLTACTYSSSESMSSSSSSLLSSGC